MRVASDTRASGRKGVGRPRDAAVDQAILAAAATLLDEVGYEGLSIEAVAARARVGKGAVYRRYSSKFQLVVEAATAKLTGNPADFDRGSLREDLLGLLRSLKKMFGSPESTTLLLRLITEASAKPEVWAQLESTLFASRRSVATAILQRAQARGEVRRSVDADLLFDMIGGALMLQAIRERSLRDAMLKELADFVADAVSR